MMNETPAHEILGVPAEAEKREVKRAYAQLLKRHRPDEDPEGFRRIHDAYQRMLLELEFGPRPQQGTIDVSLDPEMPSNLPTPTPNPVPSVEPVSAVDTELPPLSLVPPLVPPELPPRPPPLLFSPPLSLEVDVPALFEQFQHGNLAEATRQLETLCLFDERDCRRRLAEFILDAPPVQFDSQQRILFVLQLAEQLAFRHPDKANALLDRCYEFLPLEMRESSAERVGWFTGVAPLFQRKIAPRYLCFWSVAMAQPDLVDWNSDEAHEALAAVQNLGFWEGYALLRETVPTELQRWRITPPPMKENPAVVRRQLRDGLLMLGVGLFMLAALFGFGFWAMHNEQKTGADLDAGSAMRQFVFENNRHSITIDGVQYVYVIKTNPRGIKRVVVKVGMDYHRFTEPAFEVWKTNDLHKVAAPE